MAGPFHFRRRQGTRRPISRSRMRQKELRGPVRWVIRRVVALAAAIRALRQAVYAARNSLSAIGITTA